MRYIKVLILAVFIFLCLIFFFQNQAPLSQEMQMTLNLFFIPPMTSITLPFYFLLIAAFFLGCVLCWLMLIWDRINVSAKLMKSHSLNRKLAKQVAQLQRVIDDKKSKEAASLAIPASTTKTVDVKTTDDSVYPPRQEEDEAAPKDTAKS